MIVGIYAVMYFALLVFVAGTAARAARYARIPMHLRWELYPVPHEERTRASHGGSSFEVVNHWEKPARRSRFRELRFMTVEIVFLKGLWDFNRALWFCSFPFHFGLYLVAVTIALLAARAAGAIFVPGLVAGGFGYALRIASLASGAAGMVLGVSGATALVVRRLTDDRLRASTRGADIFNLVFFAVALGAVALGYLSAGSDFQGAAAFVRGLLTLDTSIRVDPLLAAGLVLGSLLLAYIPFTHMSHFVGKYFTYHSVRWDDRVNVPGGRLETRIAECLAYRPRWSATHVGADGARSWADVATSKPGEGVAK